MLRKILVFKNKNAKFTYFTYFWDFLGVLSHFVCPGFSKRNFDCAKEFPLRKSDPNGTLNNLPDLEFVTGIMVMPV